MHSSLLAQRLNTSLTTFRPNSTVERWEYGGETPLRKILDHDLASLITYAVGDVSRVTIPNVRAGIDRLAIDIPVEILVYKVFVGEGAFQAMDIVTDTTEGFAQWVKQYGGQLGMPDNEVVITNIDIMSGFDTLKRQYAFSKLTLTCQTLIPGAAPEGMTYENPIEIFEGPQSPWQYPVSVEDMEGRIDQLNRGGDGKITAEDGTVIR